MLLTVGLNHKTAPVDIRERLAFGPDIIVAAMRGLHEKVGVSECIILSTCNRTEIYCAVDEEKSTHIEGWLIDFHGLEARQVSPYLYRHEDKEAVQHLMSVACGLDSLVLGEPQILGQVKNAWQTACTAKACGKLLDRLFQRTFAVAKQVRTDTAIGSSPVSIAFSAVTLAKQIFASLEEQTAMLIGAGETIDLAARHLHQQGVRHMIIANRTLENARKLAKQFDAYAISLTEIPAHLAEADIVISSTASPLPILGKGTVESALKKRRHRPMFMVDIAVPRDIEAEVGFLNDIYLYSVDDLQEVIQENMKSREQAAEQAQEIIEQQVEEYLGWMKSLDAVTLIHSFRAAAERDRDELLQRSLRHLQNGREADEVLKFLAHTLTNKLLHTPSATIRKAGSTGNTEILEAANVLFQLKQ